MRLFTKVTVIILLVYLTSFLLDIDDKIYSKINTLINEYKGIKSLSLEKYKVIIDAKKIDSISDNLSGITYSSTNKSLFSILNSPSKIYELSLDGEVKRVITLHGFKDTEGITFMYENSFAITDERMQEFFIVSITQDTQDIYFDDIKNSFKLDIGALKNSGYEGIAYNKVDDEFYLINEKLPIQVIVISNWLSKNKLSVSYDNKLSLISKDVDDLSGIHYNDTYKHLLLLSDESMLLTEVTKDGTQISFMDLEKGFAGLKKDIPQAEGITMDENNNIYIVSEPNLFYKLSKD